MNVIISNEYEERLASLDIDVIKSISGTFEPNEIVEMFKNFFYSKMIIDVTAIKRYTEISSYEIISKGLDPDKIIFYLSEGSSLCTPSFLSNLINLGIYNFTTNLQGIKLLLKKSNTIKDVSQILQVNAQQPKSNYNSISNNSGIDLKKASAMAMQSYSSNSIVLGFKNVTEHAGATTLIYMLKKEIASSIGKDKVVALEIDKNDFQLFNDDAMLSVHQSEVKSAIMKLNKKIVLIDLNNSSDSSMCSDVFYLVEPSIIKLNRLIRRNKSVFSNLQNRKIILNQSLLMNNDISDFENEANVKVFFNIQPIDDRKRNGILKEFLIKIGLLNGSLSSNKDNSGKIFGLFRR